MFFLTYLLTYFRLNTDVKTPACFWDTGISGNVLIDDNADRLNTYSVWDYAEGDSMFHSAMIVDLTQAPGEVSRSLKRFA